MPDAATAPETVILADGEYPAEGIPAALLAQARYVVCCDGAADAYTAHGGIPSAIVGDGDSISRTTAQRFRDILHIVPDQETNDLTKAFSFCMEQGRRELTILGATGGREDHAIGNIALLADYARQADVQMVTPYGVFNAVEGAATFDSMPRQQVSIFTIVPGTRISVRGLRYTPPDRGIPFVVRYAERSRDRYLRHRDRRPRPPLPYLPPQSVTPGRATGRDDTPTRPVAADRNVRRFPYLCRNAAPLPRQTGQPLENMNTPPVILAIAGSDPSGGAGIQADIKTVSALGGYAAAAVTAITVQNTRGVAQVEYLSPRNGRTPMRGRH